VKKCSRCGKKETADNFAVCADCTQEIHTLGHGPRTVKTSDDVKTFDDMFESPRIIIIPEEE